MVRHEEGQEQLHTACPAQMSEPADARVIVLEDSRTMSDVFDKYFMNKTYNILYPATSPNSVMECSGR